MDVRHMGAGCIDIADAARFAAGIHIGRHPVRADDHRLPGLHVVKRVHRTDSRLCQTLHFLRVVNQRPERHAGNLPVRGVKRSLYRAANAEAESGMLSDCQFHTLCRSKVRFYTAGYALSYFSIFPTFSIFYMISDFPATYFLFLKKIS